MPGEIGLKGPHGFLTVGSAAGATGSSSTFLAPAGEWTLMFIVLHGWSLGMGYDPTKPEPDHNTLRVGLAGIVMAAVLVIIFLTIMIYLYNVLHIPVR